jgi:FkbM family methyltransferase
VISIEADTNAATALRNNVRDNNCNNVHIIEKAIYNNSAQKVYFGQNENSSEGLGDSMSQCRVSSLNERDYSIDTITLKDIISLCEEKDSIKFVKVDIEGGEENILGDLFVYGSLHKWKVWVSFHYAWWKNKDINRFQSLLPLLKRVEINNTEFDSLQLFDYVQNNQFGSFYLEF